MSRASDSIARAAEQRLAELNWVAETLETPRYDDSPRDFHDAVAMIATQVASKAHESVDAVALATMGMGQ